MDISQLQENLLEAIQMLINNSLAMVPMDRTIVCTITDNSDRENGHYQVTPDGHIIYDAYSERTTYLLDEQVLVLMPQDATLKKTITSRYISNENSNSIAYVRPGQKLIECLSLDDTLLEKTAMLTANGSISTVLLKEWDTASSSLEMYNSVYLAADFGCNLQDKIIQSGHYGLLLEGSNDSGVVMKIVLDSSMMFGNPYAFTVPFTQEHLFYYNLDTSITTLKLYFYQLQDFTYWNGEEIQPVEVNTNSLDNTEIPNIDVSNIQIRFGYELESVPDNTVKLITMDSMNYTGNEDLRTVNLIWYNKDENGKYVGFDNMEYDVDESQKLRGVISSILEPSGGKTTYTYTIKGVVGSHSSEQPLKNETTNEELKIGDTVYYSIDQDDSLQINIDTTPIEQGDYYSIVWQQDNEYGKMDSTAQQSQTYRAKMQDTLVETRVDASVWVNGTEYKAVRDPGAKAPLVFENQSAINKQSLGLQGVEMKIRHGANSQDSYQLYDGMANALFEPTEAYRPRTLEFGWDVAIARTIDASFWHDATIEWFIPVSGSMLNPYGDNWTKKDDFYVLENTIQYSEDLEQLSNIAMDYTIGDYYCPGLMNNTITCKVTVTLEDDSQVSLTGNISFGFSSYGSSGTDYTVVFTNTNNNIKIAVKDKEGEEVSSSSIYYRWLGDTETWTSYDKEIDATTRSVDDYNLLEAKATVNGIQIYGRYALVHANDSYYGIVPTAVLYDSTGSNPQYYKGELQLYNSKKILQKDVRWEIYNHSRQNDVKYAPDNWTNKLLHSSASLTISGPMGQYPNFYYQYTIKSTAQTKSYDGLDTKYQFTCCAPFRNSNMTVRVISYTPQNSIQMMMEKSLRPGQSYVLSVQDGFRYAIAYTYSIRSLIGGPTDISLAEHKAIDAYKKWKHPLMPNSAAKTAYETAFNALKTQLLDYLKESASYFISEDSDTIEGANYSIHFDSEQKLCVPSLFVGNEDYLSIRAYDSKNALQFHCPIYIGQNQHTSKLLNQWDGELLVDSEQKIALAAMVGAGHKNADNTFSGVVMGERAKLDETNSALSSDIGLFGFQSGIQTYEFNVDGTAKLGAAGAGQIFFDGTQGYIQSGNYIPTSDESAGQGMRIDLQQGSIDAYNFKLTSNNMRLNSNPGENEYYIDCGKEVADEDADISHYFRFNNNTLDLKSSHFQLTADGLTIANGLMSLYSSDDEHPSTDKIELVRLSTDSILLQSKNYSDVIEQTDATEIPAVGYYYRLATPYIAGIVIRDFNTGARTDNETKKKQQYRLECSASGSLILEKIPGRSYKGYRVHLDSNPSGIQGYVAKTFEGDNVWDTTNTNVQGGVSQQTTTIEQRQISGAKIDLSNNVVVIGPPSSSTRGWIQLGGDDTYALQIGKYGVKWDGTVVPDISAASTT